MLSSLKDKFLHVKKNVPLFSSSVEKGAAHVTSSNLDAGNAILSHFQKEWKSLHVVNEENAKKAEEVADIITKVTVKVEKDKENLGLLCHIMNNSNLSSKIDGCTRQIERLCESFNVVENELVQLEDLIENIEFETMKKQHRYHLQQYKLKKEDYLKTVEAQLKVSYEKSVKNLEDKKKKELTERQQVFQEAFKNDLETFKHLGTIPKLDLPKQPSALLEEIQVDYDESELDQFFADVPSTTE